MPDLSEPAAPNQAQADVLAMLGAKRAERPPFPATLRDDLRRELEAGLAPMVRALPDDRDLFLSKATLEGVHGCQARFLADGDFTWTPAMARGVVAHRAIELAVTRPTEMAPLDLVDEAMAVLADSGRGVGDWLQTASQAERDVLRAEANTYLVKFLDCWPPLRRAWRPATEVSIRADLFDGRVGLSGRPDLTIGRAEGEVAGKVIVDFKTGRFSPLHRADLRFYAVLETLRIGTPPRMLATSYLDSGAVDAEAVTEDLLAAEVRRVVDGAHKLLALQSGSVEPVRQPGPPCRWCPISSDCEPGSDYLATLDDTW